MKEPWNSPEKREIDVKSLLYLCRKTYFWQTFCTFAVLLKENEHKCKTSSQNVGNTKTENYERNEKRNPNVAVSH